MNEFADFFPKLLLLAALLIASLAAASRAKRLGLPGPAAFLAVGIAAELLGIAPTEGLQGATLALFAGRVSDVRRADEEQATRDLVGARQPIPR